MALSCAVISRIGCLPNSSSMKCAGPSLRANVLLKDSILLCFTCIHHAIFCPGVKKSTEDLLKTKAKCKLQLLGHG